MSVEVVPSLPKAELDVTIDDADFPSSGNKGSGCNVNIEKLEAVPYLPLFNKVIRHRVSD